MNWLLRGVCVERFHLCYRKVFVMFLSRIFLSASFLAHQNWKGTDRKIRDRKICRHRPSDRHTRIGTALDLHQPVHHGLGRPCYGVSSGYVFKRSIWVLAVTTLETWCDFPALHRRADARRSPSYDANSTWLESRAKRRAAAFDQRVIGAARSGQIEHAQGQELRAPRGAQLHEVLEYRRTELVVVGVVSL